MVIYKVLSALLCALTIATLAPLSYASGGGGGGFGGSFQPNSPRKVDQIYEVGKAVYSGRLEDTVKLDYCVNTGTEIVALSRKSLKTYKKKTTQSLFENLYNCDNTEQIVAHELGVDKASYLIYYLNKRYKLKMTH